MCVFVIRNTYLKKKTIWVHDFSSNGKYPCRVHPIVYCTSGIHVLKPKKKIVFLGHDIYKKDKNPLNNCQTLKKNEQKMKMYIKLNSIISTLMNYGERKKTSC